MFILFLFTTYNSNSAFIYLLVLTFLETGIAVDLEVIRKFLNYFFYFIFFVMD